MVRKEKPKKRKQQLPKNEQAPKPRRKETKMKYRHPSKWLEREDA
jgi:hypothetical protein